MKLDIGVIDLFCGVGGLSLGLRESGMRILAGIDLDEDCRFAYEQNVGAQFLNRDVASIAADDLEHLFRDAEIRVLAACAPCQPFSGYTTKRRDKDDRWRLLLEVARLVREIRPDIVTVENVPRLARLPLWEQFVSSLEVAGYKASWGILDSADYGVPQHRKRLVLLASRLGSIELPERISKQQTVRSAIGNLPRISAGKISRTDPLHSSRSLTRINLERIKASRPSQTWRDWPESLRAKCHKRATGKTYPSVYGRMSWDKPAPTITTQFYGFGNGRFGHPSQNRAISLREGAILQSFPEDFEFLPPNTKPNFRLVGMLIGNAVPPKLAEAIGNQIAGHAAAIAGGALNSAASK